MRNLEIRADNGSFALRCPDYVDARVLAANTAESHTVPAGAAYVIFSSDGDFYARYGATASIPAADVSDGSASELNPTIRYLGAGVSSISLVATAARVVTMAFFKE